MAAVGAGVITAVVTADTGPGIQITASTFQNVSSFTIDAVRGTMTLNIDNPPQQLVIQYSNLSAITFTVATKTLTVTDA